MFVLPAKDKECPTCFQVYRYTANNKFVCKQCTKKNRGKKTAFFVRRFFLFFVENGYLLNDVEYWNIKEPLSDVIKKHAKKFIKNYYEFASPEKKLLLKEMSNFTFFTMYQKELRRCEQDFLRYCNRIE